MRSVLASTLAALLVAAHMPVPAPGGAALLGRPAHAGMSCCGEKACCAHGGACGTSETCALVGGAGSSAVGARPSTAPGDPGTPQFRVGTCGSESARAVPGSPDPGTLANPLACSGAPPTFVAITSGIAASPTRALLPAEPPPRA